MSSACCKPVALVGLTLRDDPMRRRQVLCNSASTRRIGTNAKASTTESSVETKMSTSTSDDNFSRRVLLRGLVLGSAVSMVQAPLAYAAAAPVTAEEFAQLELNARTAYRAKRLDEAYLYLTELHELEPNDGQWLERRAQVLVDLKRFKEAVNDFNAAVELYEPEYKSLGLLSNRALAYEGLSEWSLALKDYDEVVRLSKDINRAPPYVLNSRGNVLSSLGRYEEALESYQLSSETFQNSRNLSGAIYARSNAALMLAELGRDAEAMYEFEAVARRAAGSIDARAALAAMYWDAGNEANAEETWGWACDKINSGVLTEGGPALDGCALYRDEDWLLRIRRWPPSMVRKMMAFVKLKD